MIIETRDKLSSEYKGAHLYFYLVNLSSGFSTMKDKKLRRILRKPALRVSDEVGQKPDCTTTEDG